METNSQCNIEYIPYKDIVKQIAIDYYDKNKENKYDSLSPEEKKRRQEYIKNGLENSLLKDNKN